MVIGVDVDDILPKGKHSFIKQFGFSRPGKVFYLPVTWNVCVKDSGFENLSVSIRGMSMQKKG